MVSPGTRSGLSSECLCTSSAILTFQANRTDTAKEDKNPGALTQQKGLAIDMRAKKDSEK